MFLAGLHWCTPCVNDFDRQFRNLNLATAAEPLWSRSQRSWRGFAQPMRKRSCSTAPCVHHTLSESQESPRYCLGVPQPSKGLGFSRGNRIAAAAAAVKFTHTSGIERVRVTARCCVGLRLVTQLVGSVYSHACF